MFCLNKRSDRCRFGEDQPIVLNIFISILTNENTVREGEAPAELFVAANAAPLACGSPVAAHKGSAGASLSRFSHSFIIKLFTKRWGEPPLQTALVYLERRLSNSHCIKLRNFRRCCNEFKTQNR